MNGVNGHYVLDSYPTKFLRTNPIAGYRLSQARPRYHRIKTGSKRRMNKGTIAKNLKQVERRSREQGNRKTKKRNGCQSSINKTRSPDSGMRKRKMGGLDGPKKSSVETLWRLLTVSVQVITFPDSDEWIVLHAYYRKYLLFASSL